MLFSFCACMSSCAFVWHWRHRMTPTDQTFCIYNADDQDMQVRMNHDGTINDFVLKRHQSTILTYARGKRHCPSSIISLNGQKYKLSGGPSIYDGLPVCMHSLKEPCPRSHKELFGVCIVQGIPYDFHVTGDVKTSTEYWKFFDVNYLLNSMIKNSNTVSEKEKLNEVVYMRQVGDLQLKYIFYKHKKIQ